MVSLPVQSAPVMPTDSMNPIERQYGRRGMYFVAGGATGGRHGTQDIPQHMSDTFRRVGVPKAIENLWRKVRSFRYDERLPYPSNSQVADRLAVHVTVVEKLVSQCVRLGWLEKYEAVTKSGVRIVWDFEGLEGLLEQYDRFCASVSAVKEDDRPGLEVLAVRYPAASKSLYQQRQQRGLSVPALRVGESQSVAYLLYPEQASEQPANLREGPPANLRDKESLSEESEVCFIGDSNSDAFFTRSEDEDSKRDPIFSEGEREVLSNSYSHEVAGESSGYRILDRTLVVEEKTPVKVVASVATKSSKQRSVAMAAKQSGKQSLTSNQISGVLERVEKMRAGRGMDRLPILLLSPVNLPRWLEKLRDTAPGSTYTSLLSVWLVFKDDGRSVEEFIDFLGSIADHFYGSAKKSRTGDGKPQGIRMFMSHLRDRARLYCGGERWHPGDIYFKNGVVVEHHCTMEVVTDDAGISFGLEENTMVSLKHEQNGQRETFEDEFYDGDLQTEHIEQSNEGLVTKRTRAGRQANTNTVETQRLEQSNLTWTDAVEPHPEQSVLIRRELRTYISQFPVIGRPCDHCGCTLAYFADGHRFCVYCEPDSSWAGRAQIIHDLVQPLTKTDSPV